MTKEIRMEVSKISKYRNLDKTERILIAQWIKEGRSNKWIAKQLGRARSTIGREIRRNSFGEVYEPLNAQGKAERRKKRAWKAKHPLKNEKVFAYVIDHLRDGWSPEQISGRLKNIDHPYDTTMSICSETIYKFIYDVKQKDKVYWEYLRRKQKRRRKRGGRKAQRVRIPDRVSIHQRPKEVEERKKAGHWEGDSLVGKAHLSGLHTQYERVTSITRLERLKRITAEQTLDAMRRIFDPLPNDLKRSTTLDNGSEMVRHGEVGIDTYFADPYSSYQRGGNENANLWIRCYFPKGTDFSKVSDRELKDVEWELNNRPRKRLGFKTPLEVWNEVVNRQGLQ
jgi:transposase, IS30 family